MNSKRLKLHPLAASIILSATLAVVSGCGFVKPLPESVTVRDTVIVTKERKLTDTLLLQNWDTVQVTKDRVRVRLVRINDTIFVDAECPTDTFVVNTVTVNTVSKENKGRGYEFYIGWMITILCFFILFRTILNKVI
jgi:hypothetical protein